MDAAIPGGGHGPKGPLLRPPDEGKPRTAKSCGPGAATVASIHAGLCWRGNGDKNRRSPGRVRISRKPLRGESRDVLAVPVVQPVCSFATGLSHTGLRAQSAPGFPCALIKEEGQRIGKAQANPRRENEHVCFQVIASDLSAVARRAKAEAKQSSFLAAETKLDCFGAEPVIGRAFARPVGGR